MDVIRTGHPGRTNNFLVATSHDEAILRNDQSVLERMHAYICFTALRKPECNIFDSLSRTDYQSARSLIIDCILITDLSKHFGVRQRATTSPG